MRKGEGDIGGFLRRIVKNAARSLRALCLLATPALAEQGNVSAKGGNEGRAVTLIPTGAISAQVHVVDGDTLSIDGERIRLRSEAGPIDAPELRKSQCPLELFRAQAARERLAALLYKQPVCDNSGPASCTGLYIDRPGMDRYRRTVAVVYADGEDLGAKLIAEGHAKPWPKLSRADRPTWCGG